MSAENKFDPDVEARLAALPEPALDDTDNPEWTDEDFARARPASEFPEIMAALGLNAPAAPTETVAINLSRTVVDRYRAAGGDWRARMAQAVEKAGKRA